LLGKFRFAEVEARRFGANTGLHTKKIARLLP
jgi:hypothetical protein